MQNFQVWKYHISARSSLERVSHFYCASALQILLFELMRPCLQMRWDNNKMLDIDEWCKDDEGSESASIQGWSINDKGIYI